jgi:hypothetical protein
MQVIFFTLTFFIFAICITFSLFIITCIGFWNMTWVSMKRVTDCLLKKLEGKLFAHGMMDNLGVVYPQY